jgi:protein gp37
MSDLFHADVSTKFILRVFEVMNKASWHEFQVLTKRPERVLDLDAILPWAPNIWMGTSVENEDYTHRIDVLRQTNAHLKFLSLEPLLGPIDNLNLTDIDWVIAGGESGFRPRPMKEEWVISIRDQCQAQDVRFFFKQWGGRSKKKAGRTLQGRFWNEMPKEVEV